jgi:hypothetical protein
MISVIAIETSMIAKSFSIWYIYFWPFKHICWFSYSYYCNGLIECPMTSLPFLIMQHAHFCCKHTLACWCLQIEQIHACLVIVLILLCCVDFQSAYSHNRIRGIPIAKNTIIVRIGILKTNNEIPKHKVTIPRIEIQRVVVSIIYVYTHIPIKCIGSLHKQRSFCIRWWLFLLSFACSFHILFLLLKFRSIALTNALIF